MKKLSVAFLLFTLFSVFLFTGVASAGWYDSNWDYRKKITIDNTKVTATLTNFPVLVSLTNSNFDFTKAYASGADIRFTSSDGTTLLDYEQGRHDSVNELSEYWVEISSLLNSVDTSIYMYYGKGQETVRFENFLDTVNIESQSGLSYVVNRPTRYVSNPIFLVAGANNDTWDYSKTYPTVLKFGATDYRMWYRAVDDVGALFSCYATSTDGLSWTKPNLGLITYDGDENNNIMLADGTVSPRIHYDADGAADRKFVGLFSVSDAGLYVYISSDGYSDWALEKTIHLYDASPYKEAKSITQRPDGRWMAYYTLHTDNLRRIGFYLSDTTVLDGDWTDMGIVLNAKEGQSDAQTVQKYNLATEILNGLYYGYEQIYDSDSEQIALGLWVSRDGFNWLKKDIAWLPVGAGATWDDEMVLPQGGLVHEGNEWWLYYGGSPVDHSTASPTDKRIGLAKIGYNRIGSIEGTGSVITKFFKPGEKLYVNVDASGGGKLEAELLDINDQVITGYAQADADDITTDTYSTEVTWSSNSIPTDQVVKIKFYLTSAKLYAYQVDDGTAIVYHEYENVWDSNYHVVSHMGADSGVQIADSSMQANDISVHLGTDSTVTGKIGRASLFDGTEDFASMNQELEDVISIASAKFTMEAWIKPGGVMTNRVIMAKYYPTASQRQYFFRVATDSKLQFLFYGQGGSTFYEWLGTTVITNTSKWYHVALTYDGTQALGSRVKLYVDGVDDSASVTNSSGSPTNISTGTAHLGVGAFLRDVQFGEGTNWFNGHIDEIRVSNILRAATWISTQFNNMDSPSTFYSVGSEESLAALIPAMYFPCMRPVPCRR